MQPWQQASLCMRQPDREEVDMRIWFKIWQDNHMLSDFMVEDSSEETRTHKVFSAIEKACTHFDLAKPIWLDKNIREFKGHAKTRFSADSFVEEIAFDYFEVHVIEED